MPDKRLKFDIHVDAKPATEALSRVIGALEDHPVYVTPSVIRWARIREWMSKRYVATMLGVALSVVSCWESGALRPRMSQARALAALYQRPLAAFLLEKPPKGLMHWAPLRHWKRRLMMRLVPICRNIVDEWGDE